MGHQACGDAAGPPVVSLDERPFPHLWPSPGPTLLLTTTGRKTGQARTTPVFYLRDGEHIILCNVNPGFERLNPWTLNIRAQPAVDVQIGGWNGRYHTKEATDEETAYYWPQLVQMWPAYQQHFERSGQRSIFVLE